MILPFAGLELVALGACLYCCARHANCYEHIVLRDDDLIIVKGQHKEQERYCFQRYWARVRIDRPRHAWYARRLKIVSHGRAVEVGRWLNEEERNALAQTLRGHLG